MLNAERRSPPRVPGWEVALITWAEQSLGLPFVWGTRDCMQLCHQAVDLQFPPGHGLLPDIKPYASAQGAMRVLRRYGDPVAVLQARGAVRIVEHGYAHHGDLVFLDKPDDAWGWSGFVVVSARLLGIAEEAAVTWWPNAAAQLEHWGARARVVRLPNG